MPQNRSFQDRFELSKYIDSFNNDIGNKRDVISALQENIPDLTREILGIVSRYAYDLAAELESSMDSIENLAITKNGRHPNLVAVAATRTWSAEILTWAIAVLTSSWSAWIFNSKSFNPDYQQDESKPEAATNIRLARLYIRTSIVDATTIGEEIGKDEVTKYRPDPRNFPIYLKLRKTSR